MDAEQTQLIERYRKLEPLKRQIVRVFSVIYEPISRTSFLTCFNQLSTKDKTGKAYTTTGIKPHLDRLIQDQILIQNSGQGPQCNPLIVEVATRDAIGLGEFETIVTAINAQLPIHCYGKTGPRYFANERQFLREVRIGIYQNDLKFVVQQFEEPRNKVHQCTKGIDHSDLFWER